MEKKDKLKNKKTSFEDLGELRDKMAEEEKIEKAKKAKTDSDENLKKEDAKSKKKYFINNLFKDNGKKLQKGSDFFINEDGVEERYRVIENNDGSIELKNISSGDTSKMSLGDLKNMLSTDGVNFRFEKPIKIEVKKKKNDTEKDPYVQVLLRRINSLNIQSSRLNEKLKNAKLTPRERKQIEDELKIITEEHIQLVEELKNYRKNKNDKTNTQEKEGTNLNKEKTEINTEFDEKLNLALESILRQEKELQELDKKIENLKEKQVRKDSNKIDAIVGENESNKKNLTLTGKTKEELGEEEKIRLSDLYRKDIEKRREKSIQEIWEEDGKYYSFYEATGGTLTGGYNITGTYKRLEANTKEELIAEIKYEYGKEARNPLTEKELLEIEKLTKEKDAKLSMIEEPKKNLFGFGWISNKKSKKNENNKNSILNVYEKNIQLILNEHKYPFVYWAYDKIKPEFQFFPRDFMYEDENENEVNPEQNTYRIYKFFQKRNHLDGGFFEFNNLGFYMILKNSDKLKEKDGINHTSEKAIYKVIGPDGNILIDNVGYAEAKEKFYTEAEKYREKLEEEFKKNK